jgi:hypothetical protein
VIPEAACEYDITGVMVKAILVLAVGALLAAAPALGGRSSLAIPSINSSCLSTGASTIQGVLVTSSAGSLTMTVERGSGPMLAFGAVKLKLPVAPNAAFLGSPHQGDSVVVHAVACPNAEKTMITVVASKISVAAHRAGKAPASRTALSHKK